MKNSDTRILPSDITPEHVYFDRRALLAAGIGGLGLAALPRAVLAASSAPALVALNAPRNKAMSISEEPNSYQDITSYNNYYEFGTSKEEPAVLSKNFNPSPWSVTVDGEAEVKGKFTLEDILKPHPLEERVYRLRCVEAWSMVIPWAGIPLADLLKRFKPTSRAKFVEFTTLLDPKRMPGQRDPVLNWPYVEGLRIDEAMHPLAFIATGVYGKSLPNQNGAPLRLAVPWKYGFKSGKSLVKIRLVEKQPMTSWVKSAPQEYGFYANVNPNVAHPRWSQATERRIGEDGLFSPKRKTLMFNGYGDQVASLYQGMDLKANY